MESKPLIEIRNLTAKYGEKTILENINADFYPQEITVILGGSGCGKTTLLKNILKLYEPTVGSVKYWGQEITEMDEQQFEVILQRIGMLFQNGALLNSISIYDNISIPLEQHTNLTREVIDKMIKVKLHLVKLDHAMNLLPSELSGGMRKRAALARALIMDPDILFCDEPSAGLDPVTSAALDELIIDLKKQLKMTIVVVTHELASIKRIADKILFLEDGKLLFKGTLKEAESCDIESIQQFFKVGRF